ncbi:spermatogenesis-associated protein 46 [Glossophaga mutica]
MERFSLLSISGPRASSSALTALPGLAAPCAAGLPGELQGHASAGLQTPMALPDPAPAPPTDRPDTPPGDTDRLGTNQAGLSPGPEATGSSSERQWLRGCDVAKPASPTEVPSPARAPPPLPHPSSALRHGVVLSPGTAGWTQWPHPQWQKGPQLAAPVCVRPRRNTLGTPGRSAGESLPGTTLPSVARGREAAGRGPRRSPPSEPEAPARPTPQASLSSADCVLGEPPDGARPRRSCTVYRPWFSPYSYFVCLDRESRPEAPGLPEPPREEGRGDGRLPEDAADSACSSASPPDNTCLREAAAGPRPGPEAFDHITSQDLLRASRWLPAQQSGFKCAACCRMYPTLGSLRSHVRGGFREGFSCRVFYRKLKALWARPADRLSSSFGGCQAHK